MEINTHTPVKNSLEGPKSVPTANEIKGEKEETQGQEASQTKREADDRVSLSEASKKAISPSNDPQGTDQRLNNAGISEAEAEQLAQQVSTHLVDTNTTIANHAIQRAVDLFS